MGEKAAENVEGGRSSLHSIDFAAGDLINGRYRIISFIGQGGVSHAYKATDTEKNSVVALKFLLPHRLANRKDTLRFRREAMTASQLNHPSIARVFDFDLLGGEQPFLVMEFVEGETLAARIQQEGQLPIDETINIFIAICDALAYAHSQNVLHRDITPGNIMVAQSAENIPSIKLLDFGLAKLMLDSENTMQQHITGTGELLGSPSYMSPEQARGLELDCRSDLYSLGCTLFESLTGGPPHLGQTPLATILKRETDKPIPLSEASLGRSFPEQLEAIVSKLLQTDPNNRFPNASEVKEALVEAKGAKASTSIGRKEAVVKQNSRTARLFFAATVSFIALGLLLTAILYWFIIDRPEKSRPSTAAPQSVAPQPTENVLEIDLFRAKNYVTTAEQLKEKYQYKQASENYENAIAIYSKYHAPRYSLSKIAALIHLGSCYRSLGNKKFAAEAFQRAIDITKNDFGENSLAFAGTLSALGDSYFHDNTVAPKVAWKRADAEYKRAIAIFEKAGSRHADEFISLLLVQAYECSDHALIHEAEWRYEKALSLCHSSTVDPEVFVAAVGSAADLYCDQNRYDKVEPLYKELLAAFDRASVSIKWKLADDMVRFADKIQCFKYKTKYTLQVSRQARTLYERVLGVYTDLYSEVREPNKGRLGHVAYSIADAYRLEGDNGDPSAYRLAEAYYRKARTSFQNQSEPSLTLIAMADLSIGEMLQKQNRPDEARTTIKQALSELTRADQEKSTLYARGLSDVAASYLVENNWQEAHFLYSQGLAICGALHKMHTLEAAGCLDGLALCKLHGGNAAQANRLSAQARTIYKMTAPYCPQLVSIDKSIKNVPRSMANHRRTRP